MRILVFFAEPNTKEYVFPMEMPSLPAVGTTLEDEHTFEGKSWAIYLEVDKVYKHLRESYATIFVKEPEDGNEYRDAFMHYLDTVWFSSEEERKEAEGWVKEHWAGLAPWERRRQ